MDKLGSLAKILRSKNSGPFQITLDILFDNREAYRRVVDSEAVNAEAICGLYNLEPRDICCIVFFEKALGIKITYNRHISSGSCCDRDVYGAQQHIPLMDIIIP